MEPEAHAARPGVPIEIVAVWLVPLGFWALPMKSGGELWRIALAGLLAASIVTLTYRRR